MSLEWIATLLLLANLRIGHAAYYAPNVMEQVITIRQIGRVASPLPAEAPPGVTCFVATDDCGQIGQTVTVWHHSVGWQRCWITDCCCTIAGDCDRMRKRRILVEVDFETARRWGVLGKGPFDIVVAVAHQP